MLLLLFGDTAFSVLPMSVSFLSFQIPQLLPLVLGTAGFKGGEEAEIYPASVTCVSAPTRENVLHARNLPDLLCSVEISQLTSAGLMYGTQP